MLVTGLAAGAGYGLVAIGTSLVYRLTGVVHFALGELVGLSVFVVLVVGAGTDPVTSAGIPPPRLAAGVVAGLVVAVALGGATYAAVRPFLRRGSTIGWIGAVLAGAFAVRGLLAASFVREGYVFPDPLGLAGLDAVALGGGATLHPRSLVVVAAGVVIAWGAAWATGRTRRGRAMRAIATDPSGAHIVGLPVDRLLLVAFAGAGGLAAVAGFVGLGGTTVSVETGALLGLKALAAAVVAGFGSPWRVFVAGLALGVLESSVASITIAGVGLGPAFRDLAPLVVALAVLAARRRTPAVEWE